MRMKRLIALAGGTGLAVAAVVAFGALAGPDVSMAAAVQRNAGCTANVSPSTTTLTEAESAGLVYMREEERLARDVYQELGAQYSVRAFTRIAASEARHTAAVDGLLDRYGVADPADPDVPGVYQNADLQDLYSELLDQGDDSPVAALKVGIAIEELDIADLKARMAETRNADLDKVYASLLRGSENHLNAFQRLLARYGG
ncbi:MAG TPA: DUF2202 domain-containing protein [Thermoleophilia bacterium]|nr:DUF2202 domain-containing protein [Thermoleophilia bacterium]